MFDIHPYNKNPESQIVVIAAISNTIVIVYCTLI
jgi:hypothetical protein